MIRIILVTCAFALGLCLLAVLAPWFLKSPYLRFIEDHDQKYYSEVAHACDLMLSHHVPATPEAVAIAGSDVSVPRIIRDLNPSRITISLNRVHVMVGIKDFGLVWEPNSSDTNSWELTAFPEGPAKVVHVEKH